MRLAAIGLLAALAAFFSCTTARAQAPCMAHDMLAMQLDKKFGETVVARGLVAGGTLLEIFANSAHGSWTLVLSYPSGVSCIRAAGKGWTLVPEQKRPDGQTVF